MLHIKRNGVARKALRNADFTISRSKWNGGKREAAIPQMVL